MKHYLQTTEEHFQKAAQNPTQTVHESSCQATTEKQQTPQMSGDDNAGQLLNILPVGDTGLEQDPKTSGETANSQKCLAESGAILDALSITFNDLSIIQEFWPKMTPAARLQILKLIRILGKD